MIPLAITCILALAFLGGTVILFQQTVKGMHRTAPKYSVIICAAVFVIAGIALIAVSCFNLSIMFFYLIVGLIFLVIAFFLIKRNFF